MQTATQNISIRLTVIGGNDSRKQITLTGDAAVQAMQRIKDSTAPASRSLLAVNVAGEQLRYGLENLSGGAGTLGLSLARLGPVGLALAAILGTIGLATAGAIREFKEAEQATNLLTAALQTTGNVAGVTVKEIQQLGEAVEETTLFKKEEILKAGAALTSYGNIQEDVFKRALVLSTDLATRLGGDVASAADLLGAALENPEQRNINWLKARGRWDVSTGIKNKTDMDMVQAFFRARFGKAYGFRFKDWGDYQAVGQNIGTGNGTLTAFQLTKTYVSGSNTYVREIKKPITGTIKIYLNAVLQGAGYTVDLTTGIVTFTVAPSAGVAVTADYDFDVPVRFDTDMLAVRIDGPAQYLWDSIPIVETRI